MPSRFVSHYFPSFTIGLAAWLTVLETFHLVTGKPVYRRVFEFWLKIFGVTFGMGVVSGIVLAFEFGMNWSRLSEVTGPIQGPLLTYESFTAFALEASFFGVLIFGRNRLPPLVYLLSTMMVAIGTTFSAFWIMVNNSWMQALLASQLKTASSFRRIEGDHFQSGRMGPLSSYVVAAYLTGAVCRCDGHGTACAAHTRGGQADAANGSVPCGGARSGAAVLRAPEWRLRSRKATAKFAAIEGRWHDEQPAGEVLIAIPDDAKEENTSS